jgi:hydrogenase-4 component F
MRAGLKPPFSWAVYVMAILLTVIFIGFMNHFRAMYYQPTQSEESRGGRLSAWCATPMWLSLIPLLVLGLWWPTHVWDYLTSIAQSLNLGAQ